MNRTYCVSVIIPVYNAGKYLENAINSALCHKEVKEIILVEDGSNDNSLDICLKLKSKHSSIKLYQHKNSENRGAGASRNLGLSNATQEYICFLDADDIMTSIRFEKEIEIFNSDILVDGVYGAIGVNYYDNKGAMAWEAKGYNLDTLTSVYPSIPSDHLFEFLIGANHRDKYKGHFSIDSLTLKNEKIKSFNITFNEKLRLHQDTMFIMQCAYYLRLETGEIKAPVAIRGVHENNRYIHHKNLNNSNSKLYDELYKWSKKEKLNKIYKEIFGLLYFENSLKDKGHIIQFIKHPMRYVKFIMNK